MDRQRLLSVLIALGYVQLMIAHRGWAAALALLLPLAVPLVLIWYAGTISRSEQWGWLWSRRRFDRPTPPMAIRALGWVLLLVPLPVLLVRWLIAAA